jgi:hypothetical protein
MCQSHGLATAWDGVAWTSRTRTPPLYPDAVTLRPSISIPELLARLDGNAGCSIKDSFASLDLAPYGFRVLFDAGWMLASRPPPASPQENGWERVSTPEGLDQWEAAWREPDDPRGLFLPALLEHEHVSILAHRAQGAVMAGAVCVRGAGVLGISNAFSRSGGATRSGWLDLARSLEPAHPVVTYVPSTSVSDIARLGFERMGPLRVWMRDG